MIPISILLNAELALSVPRKIFNTDSDTDPDRCSWKKHYLFMHHRVRPGLLDKPNLLIVMY